MKNSRHLASISVVQWSEVRSSVIEVSPELAKIIDQINPGKKFKLYKAKYPFGALISHNKRLYFPTTDGGLDTLNSSKILPELQTSFNRRLMPTMLMLKNSAEMFSEMSDRIISGFAMRPGQFLWLWEQFDQKYSEYVSWPWSLSSGARTIYMLPKISETQQHKKLQQDYHIRANVPKSPSDHWKIFTEIANSPKFEENWNCELLFFTDNWFEAISKDNAWKDLRFFLFETAWADSSYWRHKNAFELIWEKFTADMIRQNVKTNSYLACIVKQLILTGMGVLPALTVADSDIAAPIAKIQKVYSCSYAMKEYQPLIMHSHNFSFTDKHPSYYSLQFPNLLETPFASRNIYSVLSAIPEIMKLLDDFKNKVETDWAVKGSLVDAFVKNVTCDFFHHRKETWSGINAVETLPEKDPRMTLNGQLFEKKKFSDSGVILNGCVRFINKQNAKKC